MFGHKDIPIAQINRNDNKNTIFNDSADGRFRDRLKLDQTGSLIIINTRTTDSGLYKVTSSRTDTPLNTFSLTVHGEFFTLFQQSRYLFWGFFSPTLKVLLFLFSLIYLLMSSFVCTTSHEKCHLCNFPKKSNEHFQHMYCLCMYCLWWNLHCRCFFAIHLCVKLCA